MNYLLDRNTKEKWLDGARWEEIGEQVQVRLPHGQTRRLPTKSSAKACVGSEITRGLCSNAICLFRTCYAFLNMWYFSLYAGPFSRRHSFVWQLVVVMMVVVGVVALVGCLSPCSSWL